MPPSARTVALAVMLAVAGPPAQAAGFHDPVAEETAAAVPGGTVVPGGAPLKTDCYGEWVVFAPSGTSRVITCASTDPSCHARSTRDCLFRAQVCFDDAGNGFYRGHCAAAPITMFALRGKRKDNVDAVNNWPAVLEAVAGLGTECSATSVCLPSLAAVTCTAPFDLVVPPKVKGGVLRRGVRTLVSVTTAGRRRDVDRLKLVCAP